MSTRQIRPIIALLCLCAASGCAGRWLREAAATETPDQPASAQSPLWTPTATRVSPQSPRLTATRMSTPTPKPAATRVPTPTPRPTATRGVADVCRLNPSGGWPAGEKLHGVVLFVNPAGAAPEEPVQLWAVAVDGGRAARLTLDEQGIGWYAPADPPPALWLASAGALPLEGETARQVTLPAECVPPDPRPAGWRACSGFKFSPGGEWLAYEWGPETCWRGLGMLSITGGQHYTVANGALWQFLDGRQALISTGSCEHADLWRFDLESGIQDPLGPGGRIVWNGAHTAFAVEAASYRALGASVWGFDAARPAVFLARAGQGDNQPVWAPGDEWLLYQHRAYTVTESITVTLGAREIVSVNVLSGERRVLAADGNFDYHLCGSAQPESCTWSGDWILARRLPYHPEAYGVEDYDRVQCAWSGTGCADPVELFALNWRTGELVPWGQFTAPTATTVPAPASTMVPPAQWPDSTRPVLYGDPSGKYALYLGQDGRSLWCVPALGTPAQWVMDSEAFTYVP